MVALTPTTIVNEALQLIGDNMPEVTGAYPSFDNSPAGQAASLLYGPTVATVARQFAYDFSRNTKPLVLSGNTPPPPYSLEYLYPQDALEIWQLMPPTMADPNNPLPQTWSVANAIVGAAQAKVIQTNLVGAIAVYNNNPLPSTWDPIFLEAVVRLLASKFALAVAGKPDLADSMLQSAAGFQKVSETRPD